MNKQPKKGFKSGYVNIIGKPNVGKSTLLNALIGERLSIVSPKAQTTRHRILGILNSEDYQIVFSDTPGIIEPLYELQNSMMNVLKSVFEDADILVYIIEMGDMKESLNKVYQNVKKCDLPLILIINKIDLATSQSDLEKVVEFWKTELPNAFIFPISALKKFNLKILINKIETLLPEAPPYFPVDQLTDKPSRFIVNEAIRKQILTYYKKEIPYSVEVVTDLFEEAEDLIKINAIILVERESQKGIIIGHGGRALKRVGVESRKVLQEFFGKKIFLKMVVKVSKNWRNNKVQLKKFGYINE